MARLSLALFFFGMFLFLTKSAGAQDFDHGLNLYQQGEYAEAVEIFRELDTPDATLFLGKSYLGLGQYIKAVSLLHGLEGTLSGELNAEVQYTLALAEFQLKQFGDALNRLHSLSRSSVKTKVTGDGARLYDDILNYLTLDQRRKAFQAAKTEQLRYDIISSALDMVEPSVAELLLDQLKNTAEDTSRVNPEALSEEIPASPEYRIVSPYNTNLRAPEGITYNIGAALPSYPSDASEYVVTQGLYFGYIMAAEKFNRQYPDKKVVIRYQNTAADSDSAGHALTNLTWSYNIDALLGPLFSEPAGKLAALAEEYQIPMLAPLANSDTLNTDNPYLYQANPTFASHGRKMARYAVTSLGMDTLAVITERNSRGAASAYAFREEAEKLGAAVPYFFVEDLESRGYELTDFTRFFANNRTEIDSIGHYYQLDGIYAPFTGQAASNLVDLLLIELEAMNSDLPVMGSQEWGSAQIPEERLDDREIYFTESFYQNRKDERLEKFREDFKNRFDTEPNRFAMIGYDTADFLLQALARVQNPALLKNALKEQPLYEGLISNIFFEGRHVNQEVKIFSISEQGVHPVR